MEWTDEFITNAQHELTRNDEQLEIRLKGLLQSLCRDAAMDGSKMNPEAEIDPCLF